VILFIFSAQMKGVSLQNMVQSQPRGTAKVSWVISLGRFHRDFSTATPKSDLTPKTSSDPI
jgi:hypothetical protein